MIKYNQFKHIYVNIIYKYIGYLGHIILLAFSLEKLVVHLISLLKTPEHFQATIFDNRMTQGGWSSD